MVGYEPEKPKEFLVASPVVFLPGISSTAIHI
jgi:hypothetical protein